MTVQCTEGLDVLAGLLGYPDAGLPSRVHAGLAGSTLGPAAAAELERFAAEIAGMSIGDLQEHYTGTFDLDPACALDVGWHLFGDAHDRGGFMAALREDLQQAGVPETRELPDHLTRVLALLARGEPARAAALAALVAPAIDMVHRALAGRRSPYVHVLAAVQTVVTGMGADT
jgi:nitrate reductase delta subunit